MLIDEITEFLAEEGFRPIKTQDDVIVFGIKRCHYAIAVLKRKEDIISFFTIQIFENSSSLSEYWALEEALKVTSEIIIGRCVFLERQKEDNNLIFRVSIDTLSDISQFKTYMEEYILILQSMLEKIVKDISMSISINNSENNAETMHKTIIQ